jgi:putative transcriptional regulator
MPTKKPSATPSKKSSKRSKTTPFGESIVAGLKEVAAHMRGEIKLRTRVIEVPERVDVREIRDRLGFSQVEFAHHYGFNPRTLQEWEQGRANPDGALRAYLTVIDRAPEAVSSALRPAVARAGS